MDFTSRIEAAHQVVTDLQLDEQKLADLLAEHTSALERLRAGGSKDFEGLAGLEGKRAALSTMLEEQRGHVRQASETLVSLEQQQAHAAAVGLLRSRTASLTRRRAAVNELVTELHSLLVMQLDRITAARLAWNEELELAQGEAAQLFSLPSLLHVDGHSQTVQASAARRGWDKAFKEIGEEARAALVSSPVTKYTSGMLTPYSVPEPLPGLPTLDYQIDLIKQPLKHLLDRPIALAVAAALSEVETRLPHEFKGELTW